MKHLLFDPIILLILLCIGNNGIWARLEKSFVSNTYLVEFEPKTNVSLYLASLDIQHRIRHEFGQMNAISLSFNNSQDASLFFDQTRSKVKRTWPVTSVARPNAQTLKVGKSEIPGLFDHYHNTGVMKIREELGMTGKGIKVGIIDTGVDYTHPALGGCFGSGCRVAYGMDFVGNDYNGDSEPNPSSDPRDCNGHGTHVAGIIGANDKEHQFTGVAPDVTFGAYRVFGCDGSSADDVIMKAMEQAYEDGMDVINLSLGDIGWPDSPSSVLADILTTKGMIVVAAAGNEGNKGIFEVGAPSLGKNVISVASTDNMKALAHPIQFGDNIIGYATSSGNPFAIGEAEMVSVSDTFLTENDACAPITNINLFGKVALIGRGGCYFSEKVLNVQAAGAIGVVVYNNEPGLVTPSLNNDPMIHIECAGITKEHGELLFLHTKDTPEEIYRFSDEDISFPIDTAGTISSFSSWGLAPDLSIKPDVSAPGGQIFSTFPMDRGSYATLSGTSMASPHVAGIVALLQQAKGGSRSINVSDLRAKLISSSLPFNIYNTSAFESVARQGSGLIDAYRALRLSTKVTPQQIQLGDLTHTGTNNEYTFTIHNNGRMAADYTITHRASGTAQGYKMDGSHIPMKRPNLLLGHRVEAIIESISPEKLSIPINGVSNVTVRIRPPENYADMPPSIYSGYFVITKENDPFDTLHVPYAGLTSTLGDLPVLYINQSMPEVLVDRIVGPYSPALIRAQLIHSSPLVLITALDAETDNPVGIIPGGYWPFVGRHDTHNINDALMMTWKGDIAATPEQAMATQSGSSSMAVDLGVNHRKLFRAVDHPPPFDGDDDHNNNYENISDTATMEYHSRSVPYVGKRLPRGIYKLKVMALHAFGDYENMADYDTWISPNIPIG
ncbi:peptidase S8/S53 domain-containing protein [Phascolomyces articulosus]|uniref:Peptidase S8/S53 domain-containing protein n=1 Tax=Phascolomyces articulosus TaxID=60185 RepID=A0AAD5PGW1_9FUNG|nr:peptidase S8/S53 domain-containing protein [Phascolomyces articulosus]